MSWILVGLGGALGSIARYGAYRMWPFAPGGWPLPTFAVNLAGLVRHRTLIYVCCGPRRQR